MPLTEPAVEWWQRSNRHDNGKCCSGLRVWNTDQCLVSSGSNDRLRTTVCDLEGPAAQRATVWKGPGLNLDRGCVTVSAAGVPQLGSCAGNVTKFRQHYGALTDEFKILSPKAKKVWTYDRWTDQGEAAKKKAVITLGKKLADLCVCFTSWWTWFTEIGPPAICPRPSGKTRKNGLTIFITS